MGFLYRIVEMSFTASIVGIVVYFIKKVLKNKISPKWLNLIWLVFLLTLINPIKYKSKYSIYNVFELNDIENVYTQKLNTSSNLSIKEEAVDEVFNVDADDMGLSRDIVFEILVFIYSLGVLIKFVLNIYSKLKLSRAGTYIKSKRLKKLLEVEKARLNIKCKVELVSNDFVSNPAICNIFKPTIFLPDKILSLTDNEIRLVFLHELYHLKKGDLIVNSLINFFRNIYWFNPIVIFLLIEIKKDMEFANDEFVIEKIGRENLKNYCMALFKVVSFSNKEFFTTALSMAKGTKDLERRVRLMKIGNKFLNNKVLVISIIFVLSLVVTVCFATDKLIKTSNEETNSIFVLPLNKDLEVTYCYGDRVHPITNENITHTGVDLKANQGDEVCSIADGIVVECGYDFRNGNSVKIKHTVSNEEIYSKYNHLSKIDVNLEDNVVAGSKIGEVGSTGMSTGPHLHLEILDENNNYINPSSIFAELK